MHFNTKNYLKNTCNHTLKLKVKEYEYEQDKRCRVVEMMNKLVPRGRKQVDLYFNFMRQEKNNKKTDHVNISVLKF